MGLVTTTAVEFPPVANDTGERRQLRRGAAAVTIAFLTFSHLLTALRAPHIPASGAEIAFRGTVFTLACLILCAALYRHIERLPALRLPRLAMTMLAMALGAGALTACSLVAAHFLISGGALHRDAELGRFLAVSTYWTWFFLAWLGCLLALKSSVAAKARVPAQAGRPGADVAGWATDLWVTDKGRIERVPVGEIVCVEASGDYVLVHAGDRRHMIHESLTSLAKRLDPARFMRVHRSWLVRLDAIDAIEPTAGGALRLELRNGVEARVSRARRHAVRKLLRERYMD